jgi:hypothetical protein
MYYRALALTEGWWGFKPNFKKGLEILRNVVLQTSVPQTDPNGYGDLACAHIFYLCNDKGVGSMNEQTRKRFWLRLKINSTKCPNSALACWLVEEKITGFPTRDFTLDNLKNPYADNELEMEVKYFLNYKDRNFDPNEAIDIPNKDLLFPPTLREFTGRHDMATPIYDELLCIRPNGQTGRNAHYPSCLFTTGFGITEIGEFVPTKNGGTIMQRCHDYIQFGRYFEKMPTIYIVEYPWQSPDINPISCLHNAMRMVKIMVYRKGMYIYKIAPVSMHIISWLRTANLSGALEADMTLFNKIKAWMHSMEKSMINALVTGELCMRRMGIIKDIRVLISRMIYTHWCWDAELWDQMLNPNEKLNPNDFKSDGMPHTVFEDDE